MIEKIRNEDIRAREVWQTYGRNKRSDTDIVRPCGEKD